MHAAPGPTPINTPWTPVSINSNATLYDTQLPTIIGISIKSSNSENIINTIDEVKKITSRTAKDFPENVDISFGSDQSKGIKTMLNSLQNNVIAAITEGE